MAGVVNNTGPKRSLLKSLLFVENFESGVLSIETSNPLALSKVRFVNAK